MNIELDIEKLKNAQNKLSKVRKYLNDNIENGKFKTKEACYKCKQKLLKGYKDCKREGDNKKYNSYVRYMYYRLSFCYLHGYQSNYYTKLVQKNINRQITRKEFRLKKLRDQINVNNIGHIYINPNVLFFYRLQDRFNDAHLLFYAGRFIPAINICQQILKYYKSNNNTSLNFNFRMLFCNVYNLLFYLVLAYLYDTKNISNERATYLLISYNKEFLKLAPSKGMDVQKDNFKKMLPILKKSYNKIRGFNKLKIFHKLFSKMKLFKHYNDISPDMNEFMRWINEHGLGLSISDDLYTNCQESLTLPNITHDYYKNIRDKYMFSLFELYLINNRQIPFNYRIEFMKSSFISLYSTLDEITSILTIWSNNYNSDKNPMIFMKKAYNKEQRNDYLLSYVSNFYSKSNMKILGRGAKINDPLDALYWIAQTLNDKTISGEFKDCRKLRNALVHRILFIKYNKKANMEMINNRDKYSNYDGSVNIGVNVFKSLLSHLVYICRESVIMLLCVININGRQSSKFIKDELKVIKDELNGFKKDESKNNY